MEKRTADDEDAAKITADFTVDSVSLILQEKQSGNKNSKGEDQKVNPYKKMRLVRVMRKTRANPIEQTASNQVETIARKKIKPQTIKLNKSRANNRKSQEIELIY